MKLTDLILEMKMEDTKVMEVLFNNLHHSTKKGGYVHTSIKGKTVSVALLIGDDGKPDTTITSDKARHIHRFHATLDNKGNWKIIQTNGVAYTPKRTLPDQKAAAKVNAIFNLLP